MTTSTDRPAPVNLSGRWLATATIVTGLGVTHSTLTASIVFVSLPSLATAFAVAALAGLVSLYGKAEGKG